MADIGDTKLNNTAVETTTTTATRLEATTAPAATKAASVKLDPMHASTPIHYPRMFLYLAIFLIPLTFSFTYVFSNSVYKVTVMSNQPGSMDFTGYVGLFQLCIASTQDGCQQLSNICANVNASNVPQNLNDALCGGTRKTAAAFGILALISGVVALVIYIDNFLVWQGLSCLYKPKAHTVDEVIKTRSWFRRGMDIALSIHAFCILMSLILVNVVKNQFLNPIQVDNYWGIYLSSVTFAVDVIFVVLYYFMDKYLFFVVPSGSKFNPTFDA